MASNHHAVRIFIMPRQSCGPQACSCGSIGQSEEQIRILKSTIEQAIDCQVEVYDATSRDVMKNHPTIIDLLRSFGLTDLPVITLNDEVVSVGTPSPNQIVSAVWEKMSQLPLEYTRD
jgi:hypothetical protein